MNEQPKNTPSLTVLQSQAITLAEEWLKNRPWFKGICLDTLPKTDQKILELGMQAVVDRLVCDTCYWDA
jgi:hypothetical protein